jgi:hypothetical protein
MLPNGSVAVIASKASGAMAMRIMGGGLEHRKLFARATECGRSSIRFLTRPHVALYALRPLLDSFSGAFREH